jgi:hypothetical protein
MQKGIDINIAVDSVAALSNKKLEGSIWLFDNSPFEGDGQGTTNLSTICVGGQVVNWKITAVDLQTPATIKFISFFDVDKEWNPDEIYYENSNLLDAKQWSAIVPITMTIGKEYRYRLAVQIGEGKNSVMYIDSPTLVRI